MKDHNLIENFTPGHILVEHRPVQDRDGNVAHGLHSIWITLNNPGELNSYTTSMAKEIILALRAASNDRAAVAVVLTGAGSARFAVAGTHANTRGLCRRSCRIPAVHAPVQ
jgi:Enoyl-CoA hydratase/carnithine racemase